MAAWLAGASYSPGSHKTGQQLNTGSVFALKILFFLSLTHMHTQRKSSSTNSPPDIVGSVYSLCSSSPSLFRKQLIHFAKSELVVIPYNKSQT